MRHWPRSQYEKVIHRVVAGDPMRINGKSYTVERMRGWYEIVFRETKTGARRVFNLDDLVRLTRDEAAKEKARVVENRSEPLQAQ